MRVVGIGEVDDHRVIRRALLQLEDAAHGRRVLGVGAQPVDRFGGENDEFAVTQRGDGVFEFDEGCTNDTDHKWGAFYSRSRRSQPSRTHRSAR